MKNIFYNLISLIILGVFVFFFHTQIENSFFQLRNQYLPCTVPIAYSIGTFDDKFGVSQEDFLSDIKDAEAVWEGPSGKDLFVYDPNGHLKINLVYDNRQGATVQLKGLGKVVDTSKASYNDLKSKFDSLKKDYSDNKKILDTYIAKVDIEKSKLEQEVNYWNDKGGAPANVYTKLQEERSSVNSKISEINKMQSDLSRKAASVNALVVELNQLASSLNLNINKFNEVGGSNGEEFEEGIYESGPEGTKIDIYQFDNKKKLVRVLAHELGHALGLEHIDNPDAIMYKLNNGTSEKATQDDLDLLKAKCNK